MPKTISGKVEDIFGETCFPDYAALRLIEHFPIDIKR